jgi:hypothetical protein
MKQLAQLGQVQVYTSIMAFRILTDPTRFLGVDFDVSTGN